MKKGVIYTAIGQKYIEQAKTSAKSIKAFCPEMDITLFTDKPQEAKCDFFDNILETENSNSSKNQFTLDKLLVFYYS